MNRVLYFLGGCAAMSAITFGSLLYYKTWIPHGTLPRSEGVFFKTEDVQRMFTLAGKQSPEWNKTFTEILKNSLGAEISEISIQATSSLSPARRRTNVDVSLNKEYKLAEFFTALAYLVVGISVLFIFTSKKIRKLRHSLPDDPSEVESFADLTKTSIHQSVALEVARSEQKRIQEELQFQQTLLNQALEEKINLGHNLHDHVIQSLYATGLSLEAVKVFVSTNPTQAIHHLDVGMRTLNCTIRDVRDYIYELGREDKRLKFKECIVSLIGDRGLNGGIDFDLRIDDEVASRLNNAQAAELLHIVSEGISNSLRHGAASRVTIRLHEGDSQLCLLIQDNGKGFNTNAINKVGHGLQNMRARASRLGAQFRCISSSNSGTRLVFIIPCVAAVGA